MAIDQFDDTFMQQFTERAVKFRPVMLRGYSGGTYVFAKWLLQRGDTRLRPRAVVLTGDTLYPHYRKAIEQAFDAPVFDTYGGEGMTIAIQCARGTYHIPPIIHVDLQPEGPRMPDGQPHRIIVTSLTNTGMPFIRYDSGDLAIPADGQCECGRSWPGLKRILGRDTDIVHTLAGRNLVVHHFNNILRSFDGVEEFQVRQILRENIEIHLVTNDHYDQAWDEPKILSEMDRVVGEGTTTTLIYEDNLPIPSSGKRRYIISYVDSRDA